MNKDPVLINIKITTNLRKKLFNTLPSKRMIHCISYDFKTDSNNNTNKDDVFF